MLFNIVHGENGNQNWPIWERNVSKAGQRRRRSPPALADSYPASSGGLPTRERKRHNSWKVPGDDCLRDRIDVQGKANPYAGEPLLGRVVHSKIA